MWLRRNISEQSVGVSVIAPMVDTAKMIVTIQPSCSNMIPAMPCTIVNGKNTAIVVSVDAITEMATSLVANIAA